MSTLKQRALHAAFRRYYARRLPEFTGGFPIVLDYPVQTSPRYPLGQRRYRTRPLVRRTARGM